MSLVPAIATVSLGRATAGHQLPAKIKAAASHSMKGIEVFYECLEQHAFDITGSINYQSLMKAAKEVAELCSEYGMKVVCLQPLLFFEGLTDESARAASFERLKLWFKLCHTLETDLIQIPTNFQQHGTTGATDQIVVDLTEAAMLGLEESPVIRFAYEGVSWGTHIDTWDGSWQIVKRIDLPNFGLCLDTFHIAARVWGDPMSVTGQSCTGDADLATSMEKMVAELDVSKIFYVQIGDAERLSSPIAPHHEFYASHEPARMSWSRNARLFAFEHDRGAHLPINLVMDTLFRRLTYRGWVSAEMFSRELYEQDPDLTKRYAQRAERSWKRTVQFYAQGVVGNVSERSPSSVSML